LRIIFQKIEIKIEIEIYIYISKNDKNSLQKKSLKGDEGFEKFVLKG
jgi:hypothetical protein